MRPLVFTPIRFYSGSAGKPSLKLVAELRKLTEVSITKAREALAASNNDVSAALQWLQNDLTVSGAKKAAKVAHRSTCEGLVSASVLSRGTGSSSSLSSHSPRGHGHDGVRAALVELNCETDFVARNALFGRLVADVAHTAAFLAEPSDASTPHQTHLRPVPREQLLDAPLLSATGEGPTGSGSAGLGTVGSAIRDAIAKLGENVVLKRAVSVVHDPVPRMRADLGLRIASYVHGGVVSPTLPQSTSQGRIGALALLALKSPRLTPLLSTLDFREELERIERALARQIVGFDTTAIRGEGEEAALYDQPFMMFGAAPEGETVGVGLARWAREKQLILDTDGTDTGGLEVIEFVKWTVGETSDAA
jgi:elongation factor Ts